MQYLGSYCILSLVWGKFDCLEDEAIFSELAEVFLVFWGLFERFTSHTNSTGKLSLSTFISLS